MEVLKGHFVFYNLAEAELYFLHKIHFNLSIIYFREYVVKQMFYCQVDSGEYIFKQGDDASSYFILGKLFNKFSIFF